MKETKTIWVDATEFETYGGWKCDTQFTHLMGSSYLIACETPGERVDNALTNVNIEEAGMYRVWVRARNWYYTHAPGKFKVSVDGDTCQQELGALPSNDWVWQIAGDFKLTKGEHALELIDLTGYFGRCSSIVLTNDMDYIPPRPVEAFEKERARCKGLSLAPVDEGSYDVIVVGAGPCGIPAAVAAARNNAKTLVISNRPIIGGNASEECGVGYNGAAARQANAKEGGIVEEIFRIKGKEQCSWTKAMEILCEGEENLTIVDDMHVCKAETENNVIKSVTARHTMKGTRHQYTGKMFIDGTGDGWLGYFAGAKYRIGREAKWQYNEEFAPEVPDLLTMSGCVLGTDFKDMGELVEFIAPEWAPKFPKGKAFGRNIEGVHPYWWNEAPNTYDDIYDAEIARDEILRILIGFFDYLKNSWDLKERAANYKFNYINYVNAKRESRRMIGDYVLTQNDCINKTEFDDVIAHSGWPIDIHHPKGMYSGEEGPYFSNTHVPLVQIPYRCIYSVNINNLFCAGRNASVTHVALGTTRVQSTIAAMAQAAGTAAIMCIEKGLTPRELGQQYIKELQQQLIKDDQYIPGIKNEDAEDSAKTCTVEASSVSKTERYNEQLGIQGDVLPLDKQRATFFARDLSEHIPALYLKICNTTNKALPLTIHVREQEDPDGFVTKEDLCVMTQMIPANSEEWVEYPVNVHTKMRYLWILVDKSEGLGWRIWKGPALDWTRSERLTANERFENVRTETHMLALKKPLEDLANCRADNVINGYSRIMSPETYCWVSDANESLPQWIQLTYPQPTDINEIHVTFDTDMNNMPRVIPIEPIPEQVVTDYIVEVRDKNGWHIVAEVNDNYMRKNVHQFETIKAEEVRITVKDSGDHKTARIFEVRSYNN